MKPAADFLSQILDSVLDSIVVIDHHGSILLVNQSWQNFALENSYAFGDNWFDINYLTACDTAAEMGDTFGLTAANGIRSVINREAQSFHFEYPCHSEVEKRWFLMRVTAFTRQGTHYYVISHHNITKRKLAEERALELSQTDGLTNIPNRRYFDQFLTHEWKRCQRLKMPLSLALIDIDHFKMLNDTYGHHQGDSCLKTLAGTITKFARRPGDGCARFGGEEFTMIFGNTSADEAMGQLDKMKQALCDLKIPNIKSPVAPYLTVSIGLATTYPDQDGTKKDLIKRADRQLYRAKEGGRNQICRDAGS